MDQLIFASLFHTHYWYEVGMLKVPIPSLQQSSLERHVHFIFLEKTNSSVNLLVENTIIYYGVASNTNIITGKMNTVQYRNKEYMTSVIGVAFHKVRYQALVKSNIYELSLMLSTCSLHQSYQ